MLTIRHESPASRGVSKIEPLELLSLQTFTGTRLRAKVIDRLNRMRHPGRGYLIKHNSKNSTSGGLDKARSRLPARSKSHEEKDRSEHQVKDMVPGVQ